MYSDFSGPLDTWHQRACKAIGQGYLTNSKRPSSHIRPFYPTHIEAGYGCTLVIEGRQYTDYICGLGTNLLGYNNARVASAVGQQLLKGVSHSLPTTLEVLAAEAIKGQVPFIDKVKFFKSGSDACTGAVKMARAKVENDLVITNGYHGWHNDFMCIEPPAIGTIEGRTRKLALEDIPDSVLGEPPCTVIIEPVMLDDSDATRQKIQAIRDACTAQGSILIFDEIITGFRVPKYTIAQLWGIQPDLICMGKAIANGFPLALVGGHAAILDQDYFISGTYFGETLSLAALIETIAVLHKPEYDLKTLWHRGGWFKERFNNLAHGFGVDVRIDGYNTRGRFAGNQVPLFFQECARAGILFGPSWFYNFPLMHQDDATLSVVQDIFQAIQCESVRFAGELPESPFAARVRG